MPHDQSPHEDCLKTTVVGIKHEDEITLGARAGDVAGGTPVPQAQANLYAFASIDVPAPWLSYAVRRPVSLLVDPVEVQRLAAQEPDAVVFVQRSTVDTAHAGVFDALAGRAIVRRDPYETVRLGDLADALR